MYSVVQLVGQVSLAGITSSLLLVEVQQTAQGMSWPNLRVADLSLLDTE